MIRVARAARDQIVRRAGLEDDLLSARIYLGEMSANLVRPTSGVPEPGEPDRIRLFGQPSSLVGVLPGVEAKTSPVSLTLLERPWDVIGTAMRSRSVITITLLAVLVLATLSHGHRPWPSSLALVTALGLAGQSGGPLILLGRDRPRGGRLENGSWLGDLLQMRLPVPVR